VGGCGRGKVGAWFVLRTPCRCLHAEKQGSIPALPDVAGSCGSECLTARCAATVPQMWGISANIGSCIYYISPLSTAMKVGLLP